MRFKRIRVPGEEKIDLNKVIGSVPGQVLAEGARPVNLREDANDDEYHQDTIKRVTALIRSIRMITRRHFVASAAGLVAALLITPPLSQAWPRKPGTNTGAG